MSPSEAPAGAGSNRQPSPPTSRLLSGDAVEEERRRLLLPGVGQPLCLLLQPGVQDAGGRQALLEDGGWRCRSAAAPAAAAMQQRLLLLASRQPGSPAAARLDGAEGGGHQGRIDIVRDLRHGQPRLRVAPVAAGRRGRLGPRRALLRARVRRSERGRCGSEAAAASRAGQQEAARRARPTSCPGLR